MTTIIAIETPDGVQFGYDSKGSGDYDGFQMDGRKVFAVQGAVYGVAGKLGFANQIRHASMPKAPAHDWDCDRWVTNILTPRLRDLAESAAPKSTEDGVEANILVAVCGRVYEITGDLSWCRRRDGMYAIGSGSDYALGALRVGASVEQALGAAAYYDLYTGYELYVTTAAEELAG